MSSLNDVLSLARERHLEAMNYNGPYRWRSIIEYIDGSQSAIFFDEFFDLGFHIERGSDWNTIAEVCASRCIALRTATTQRPHPST